MSGASFVLLLMLLAVLPFIAEAAHQERAAVSARESVPAPVGGVDWGFDTLYTSEGLEMAS